MLCASQSAAAHLPEGQAAGRLDSLGISRVAAREEGPSRLEFVPFEPSHLASLRLQAAQAYLQPLMARPEYGAAMVGPHAWSGAADGRIVGCAGVLAQWPGRAICWALLSRDLRTHDFQRVHRKVTAVLARVHAEGTRRIETSVDAGFDAGHRWVRALGFAPEGLMRAYSPEGRDHLLYARIAHGGTA